MRLLVPYSSIRLLVEVGHEGHFFLWKNQYKCPLNYRGSKGKQSKAYTDGFFSSERQSGTWLKKR